MGGTRRGRADALVADKPVETNGQARRGEGAARSASRALESETRGRRERAHDPLKTRLSDTAGDRRSAGVPLRALCCSTHL